jgi:hypothetical protein
LSDPLKRKSFRSRRWEDCITNIGEWPDLQLEQPRRKTVSYRFTIGDPWLPIQRFHSDDTDFGIHDCPNQDSMVFPDGWNIRYTQGGISLY